MFRTITTSVIILFCFLSFSGMAQIGIVKGRVLDDDAAALPSVSVTTISGKGTLTDFNGEYSLKLPPGKHELTFSFIGYDNSVKSVEVSANGVIKLDVVLNDRFVDLDVAVVSAGKFEQDLSEVTVSMDVVKPSLIENRNTTNMEDLLQQSPGVSLVDGEPQIRSGSGYSFGAGSRVMILVDDLPILSGDAGRPSWGFLPIENVQQIEIIKGASSVLYGSAALSGVINLRTAYPADTPLTKLNLFGGLYSDPQTSEGKYWEGSAAMTGFNFLHSRRFGNTDLVIGANFLGDDSYLGPERNDSTQASSSYNPFNVNRYDADSRGRLSVSLTQHSKKIKGLDYGVSASLLQGESLAALLWNNDTTGLYDAFEGSATRTKQVISTLDPFVEYSDGKGGRHSLRTRWQSLDNDNDNNQGNFSDVYYSEYQFQKKVDSGVLSGLNVTTGVAGTYTESISQLFAGTTGEDNALNVARNVAAYAQFDKKFGRLNASAGVRYEYFDVNRESNRQPVFRCGLNYQIAEATYIRSSFGQGFRFPTIAEKFINTAVGQLIIYPNEELEAEKSWSAEIGVKQGFKIGDFKGFLDAAFFWQEYDNFIEFTFGKWGSAGPLYGYGFRSVNTGSSRVTGAEVTLMGTADIGKSSINVFGGYTYTLPISTTPDLIYADSESTNSDWESSYQASSSDTRNNILKYRLQHLVRMDVEWLKNAFQIGVSTRYNSRMQNIDNAFILLEENSELFGLDWGLTRWREEKNSGDILFDGRIGYTFANKHRFMLIVSNMLNREYAIRPLSVEAPRLTTIQYTLKF